MPNSLRELADRYWQLVCEETPAAALMAGQPTGFALLRESPEDHARRLARATGLLAELQAIDRFTLAATDRRVASLLERELRRIVDGHAVRAHQRPTLFPFGPDMLLTSLANMVNLLTEADAADWIRRLAGIPEGLAGLTRTLHEGLEAGLRQPRHVLELVVAHRRAVLAIAPKESAFQQPFTRAAGRSAGIDALADDALRVVTEQVYPALQAYAEFLAGPMSAKARDSLACTQDLNGVAHYAFLIENCTSLTSSPDAIHALGLDEVARIEAQMHATAAESGFAGNLAGFRAALKSDPAQILPSAEALREQFEILSKRIEMRLPEFFGHLPRITYGIRSIPEAMAPRMPPAYAQRNPADRSGPGIHWVTSLPAMSPRYLHVPLALHEAWPGHLMHVALIQEQSGLPDFVRYGASSHVACMEGWALYCEWLGHEMGLYDTPHKRYGQQEMEMWRAVRLVVDTGIHARGWSRQQALDYAGAHLAMPAATLEAEIDRYIAMPAQALAYQLGHLAFRRLRECAQRELGSRFRLRDFHDALMAVGAATLPVLDDTVTDWIAQQMRPSAAPDPAVC